MNRLAVTAYLGVLAIGTGVFIAEARPVYARQESKDCGYCHVRSGGGGERGFRGQFYGANGLTFKGFEEKREALIAGLSAGAEGVNTIPAISYNGNVLGPATQQIQLASLRGPVLLVFLDKADDKSKAVVKSFAALAKSYGTKVTLLGVAKTDPASAIKLTDDLGGLLRVYPDPDGDAIKKFSATQIFDLAVVAKIGDPIKTLPGFSRANVEAAMKLLTSSQAIPTPSFDMSLVSEKAVRGAAL
jgi:hypothetical protein